MIRLMRVLAGIAVCAMSASALLAQSTTAPVKVNPSAVVKKVGMPPPANATKGTSIGKGKVNTANSPGDADSVWAEKIDVDGDGNVDDAQALWDDEDKVLYYSKDGTFTCTNGGTGSGGIIVAVYAEGNVYKKAVNSGWWVAEVDKDECKSQASGLVGCKFDGTGANTACGMAVIDNKTDDITIVAAKM